MSRQTDSEPDSNDEFAAFDQAFEDSRQEFAETKVRSASVMSEHFSQTQAAAKSSFANLREASEEEFEREAAKVDARFRKEQERHLAQRHECTRHRDEVCDTGAEMEHRLEDLSHQEVLGSLRDHLAKELKK